MASPIDEVIDASVRGDLPTVKSLVGEDPKLATAANMLGSTALHAAHYSGHVDIAEFLISADGPLDGFLAAELGLCDALRDLLRETPNLASERNAGGATALHGACYWGSADAARLLLDHGADVNAVTTDPFLQIHPLGCAVATPDVPCPSQDESAVLDIVDLLLDCGAVVNARRRDGMTALHSAACRGHLRVIRRLLERGADPDIRALDDGGLHAGQSALDAALAMGQGAAAELLRESGD